jgi:hypothetical protein
MQPTMHEHILFYQALIERAARRGIAYRDKLDELAELMMRTFKPRARA